MDTCRVANTVSVIDEYMTIRTLDRPVCKAVAEDVTASQLTNLDEALIGQTKVLTAQSAILTAQSEVLCKLMSRLETLEHCHSELRVVESCHGALRQSGW